MTVTPDLAEKLRRAAGKASRWTEERDRLIHEARKSGGSLREIADMVGLSHTSVRLIHDRVERDQSAPDET